MIYFCHGYRDLTLSEFEKYYVSQIDVAIKGPESEFIICDAAGADYLCYAYLKKKCTHKVTIYHMFKKSRVYGGGITTNINKNIYFIGGFKTDEERDSAATAASDLDIVWVRVPNDIKNFDMNRLAGPEQSIIRRNINNEKINFVRDSWDTTFMETCVLLAKRSTCLRLQTAAILINPNDNNIISIGYNGACSNQEHCSNYWMTKYFKEKFINERSTLGKSYPTFKQFLDSDEFYHDHHEWSNQNELHAEQNAIIKNVASCKGLHMYSLYASCINCAKVIVSSGIKKFMYRDTYKRDTNGLRFLEKNGVVCIKL